MRKVSVSAALAAGLLASGLSMTSANAADLGGDCCADLEERVAELEATTARKGNRKVSLTISGWIAEQVTYWDDGVESNFYVTGVGVTLSSHFKFTGEAKIAPGYSAGYVLHVETNSGDPTAVNQNRDDAGVGLSVLQSCWFFKSDTLGQISVGQQS
ncbi:MAG: porin, partial [Hyphomicrobiaceae bacterium]